MKPQRIAVIPGDGIGKEVMPEGLRILDVVSKRFNLAFDFVPIEWSSCDWYAKHGEMMPKDWNERLSACDAIFFGAIGWPATVPDHISLWGSLLQFRRAFDQYVNLRPCRLMPGVRSPLVDRTGRARAPGEIDFWIVRENTEGEYSSVGGRMYPGTDREIAIQETIMSRVGVDRIAKFAFELAQSRPKKHLTSATKSRDRDHDAVLGRAHRSDARRVSRRQRRPLPHRHPHRALRAASRVLRRGGRVQSLRRHPLGPRPRMHRHDRHRAVGHINPEGRFPSLFEPVHGSAPDIAGQGIANPIGMIWSASMMLEHLGHADAGAAILRAIEETLADPQGARTKDLGGTADTKAAGKAIADRLEALDLVNA